MASVTGDWQVQIRFIRGKATGALHLEEDGQRLQGRYHTQYGRRSISGRIDGDRIEFHVGMQYEHCGASYGFGGRIDGDRMSGQVGLGEYWQGEWEAERIGS